MTGLEISIHVLPSKRREFLQALQVLAPPDGHMEGCLSIAVFEEAGAPNHFLWLERWQRDALVEGRLSSEEFHALLGAIKVLGELQSVEVVRFEHHRPGAQIQVHRVEETPRS